METTITENTITSTTLTLVSLLGEYHAPLKFSGHSQIKGLVIYNNSLSSDDHMISSLFQLEDTKRITSIKCSSFSVPNNALCFYLPTKYDREDNLQFYLNQDNFQSVILCAGILPDCLQESDIISLTLSDFHLDSVWLNELNDCKQYFRNHPEHLAAALTLAVSSECYQQIQVEFDSVLSERLTIVSEIFLYWYRTTHTEQETEIRRNAMHDCLTQLFCDHINCFGDIDVADVFTCVLYDYLDTHMDISYCNKDMVEGKALENFKNNRTILWDDKCYLINPSLMKEVYTPLLSSIGERTLLNNLVREGVILSDSNSNHNLTRKKVIGTAYGPMRKRFYYLSKEALQTCNNLSIEERGQNNDISR